MSDKINIGIGVLSWAAPRKLERTLASYESAGLFDLVEDFMLYFQEISDEDLLIAEKFGLRYEGSVENIGIGKGFIALANSLNSENILLLENDWVLVEKKDVARKRLERAVKLLDKDFVCVRMRHRYLYGYPHYSVERYKGKELEYYDNWIKLKHPHLIDSIHWLENPEKKWPDKISLIKDHFACSSRFANWTNNPCVYKKKFYIDLVGRFSGEGIDLEENISYWWARKGFNVAQGEGLFCHFDPRKNGVFHVQNLLLYLRMQGFLPMSLIRRFILNG